jgi:hypothetical protein
MSHLLADMRFSHPRVVMIEARGFSSLTAEGAEVNNTPNRVTSDEQLRSFYGDPSLLSQQKLMDTLDEHCRTLVSLSPFVCIATIAADGSLDVSPRGDPPGSIHSWHPPVTRGKMISSRHEDSHCHADPLSPLPERHRPGR